MKKTVMGFTLILMAAAATACSSSSDGWVTSDYAIDSESLSIAEQLSAKGFSQDLASPPKLATGRTEEVTITQYEHADGRAAVLLRSDSGVEHGMIYDPEASEVLETLEVEGDPAVTPASSGCNKSWIVWSNPFQFTVWDSRCDGSSGTLCWTSIFVLTADVVDDCESTSCSCSGPTY